MRLSHRTAAEGNQLIEQAQTVAHAAIGRARQQRHGRHFEGDLFRDANGFEPLTDQSSRQSLQTELQAARQDVTGSFCGSVVASRNFTCGGGSSSVFSNALKEWFDSMCTSSMRYTL